MAASTASSLQQIHNLYATVDVVHSTEQEQQYVNGDYSMLHHDASYCSMYMSVTTSNAGSLHLTLTDVEHTWQLQWTEDDLRDHCQRHHLKLKNMLDMVQIFKTAFTLPHHLYIIQPPHNGTSKRAKHSEQHDSHSKDSITLHTIYKISDDMELTGSLDMPLLHDDSSRAALSTMMQSLVSQAVQQQTQHMAAVADADEKVANELKRLQALVHTRDTEMAAVRADNQRLEQLLTNAGASGSQGNSQQAADYSGRFGSPLKHKPAAIPAGHSRLNPSQRRAPKQVGVKLGQ